MKIMTSLLENGRCVSINCDQVLYVMEHQDNDKCTIVTAAGDILVVKTPYLEAVGFLKADH